MKRLTDRSEIAQAINFKKYPVVTIDLAKTDDYGIAGTPVNIDNGTFRSGEPYYIHSVMRAYNDEKVLTFHSGCVCLSNSFTYSDMEDLLTYANAPVIKPDQDILICLIDSAMRQAYAPMIVHTSKHVSPHCSTPLTLEDRVQVIF